MGGHIAMTYAALYPAEVKSLWLLDPGGIWSAPKSELAQMMTKTGQNLLMAKSEDEFALILPFVMHKPPFVPGPLLNVMARQRMKNYEARGADFQTDKGTDSAEGRVKGLNTPTLIVWGKEDRVINVATAEILHRLMPRSQVIIMPAIGHVPMIESPRQAADDYLKFRASIRQ